MRRLLLLVWLAACGSPTRPTPVTPPGEVPAGGATAAAEPVQLAVLESTLATIGASYVDAKRVDLRKMFVGALEGIQEALAEVIVEDHPDRQDVTVRVNQQREAFPTSDLDTPDRLATRIADVFRFVRAHKNPSSDLTKVEYDAVNGLLATLDPHSNLLDPEAAKELEVSITGKFGGIGVVIGAHKTKAGEGRIIVREMIAGDTPARRSGLREGDVFATIDGASTENLTLEEAMSRLRGDPGTAVSLVIEREGAPTATKQLTRSEIRSSAVRSRMIGRVGYLEVTSFSTDVALDTGRAMDELLRKGAKGWVLDLRANGGGLLGEAVKIADRFVSSGTIVTTVSPNRRRPQGAGAAETDDKLPLAVLVSDETASAAEILAGALKYLDRAAIIGTTTFGKGSVQVLFDNDDGSRLKLTIAQYLTARDLSIQGVGIVPDLQLERLAVPGQLASFKDVIHLVPDPRWSEADLDHHLTNTAIPTDKPADSVRYLGAKEDLELDFAVDLVTPSRARKRAELVEEGKQLAVKVRKREETKLAAALGKLGIDWRSGPHKPTQLVATFAVDHPRITAGEAFTITGTVRNTGTAPAFQVRTRAKTDDEALDGAELVFGRIEPGATKTATVQLQTTKSAAARAHSIQWVFDDQHVAMTSAPPQLLVTEALPRPRFAYTYQLVDEGNRDGLVQPGEHFRVHLRVKNVGVGPGVATTASLRTMAGDRVVVGKGRFELSNAVPGTGGKSRPLQFGPGQTRDVDFTFDVRAKLDLAKLPVELVIYDSELREGATEKLELAVRAPQAITTATGSVTIAAAQRVRTGASPEAEVAGLLPAGAVVRVTGRSESWVRIELEPGVPGFLPTSAVKPASAPASNRFVRTWQRTPPVLSLAGVATTTATTTADDHWKLTGTASDDTQVDDVYVSVSNVSSKIERRKVFYQSNRGTRTPSRLAFAASIPLWPGSNRITVVARESERVKATQTLWIYRAR
ncbi:MAG: S41 family peptidase [Kofleriaceae bacterium]